VADATADPALLRPRWTAAPVARPRYLQLSDKIRQEGNAVAASPPADPGTAARQKVIEESFRALEDALARVEQVTKRALTNAQFGLGAPDVKFGLGAPDVKFGLGAPDVKFGLGGPDVKFGLGGPDVKFGLGGPDVKFGLGGPDVKFGLGGPDIKFGLGAIPWLIATDSAGVPAPSETATVAILYAHVARAMQMLEEALARLEAMVLPDGRYEVNGDSERLSFGVERAFREFQELADNAKQTTRWVIAHPMYGLGPGSENGLGFFERQQLASAGGFSPRFLRLL
jgi:hypothetical protein